MQDWHADRVKRLRERLGLTQQSLAALLKVGLATISRWENGVNQPSIHLAEKLDELEREANQA